MHNYIINPSVLIIIVGEEHQQRRKDCGHYMKGGKPSSAPESGQKVDTINASEHE